MAKVTDQDREHALYPLLNKWIHSTGTGTTSRLRPYKRSSNPFSYILWLWWQVLRWIIYTWRSLTPQEKQWWYDNCPDAYKSGYTFFLVWHLYLAGGAGPFTVKGDNPIGACYIGRDPVRARICVGFSIIGSYAEIG